MSHTGRIIERMFEREFDPIPPGLDEMEPGSVLAAYLSSIDPQRVSAHDRVIVLRATQRMASHIQAKVYGAMSAISDAMESLPVDEELTWDAAATEIQAALRLTRRAAESELAIAHDLAERLPALSEAMLRGDIDRRRAGTILRHTSHLDEATARAVCDQILDEAPRLTTGQLMVRLRRMGIEADPDAATAGYSEAVDSRRVVLDSTPKGSADLAGYDLPAERAREAADRIDRIAKSLKRKGETRTIDQLRADVYLDLLCGTTHTATGDIELQVDLETLARLSDSPGDLAGYGPVVADIARQLADAHTNGEWRFTITDPRTGLPVHNGTTRRRPNAAQRRTVATRDRTCIFPGCRMPATQCDLDHRTRWAECHHTDSASLDALCRYHHVTTRHRVGWIHHPLAKGDHLWTSPLGHQYTTSGLPP